MIAQAIDELHRLPEERIAAQIEVYDREMTGLTQILRPPFEVSNALFQTISDTEIREPRQIIDWLH